MATRPRRFSLAALRANFEPPDLGSGDLNRRARLLHTILIFLFPFTLILGFIPWQLIPNPVGLILVVIALLVEVVAFFILKSGRVRPAAIFLASLLWALLTLTILLSDGVRSPAVLGQLLLILLAGLLINVRFSARLTVITIAGDYAALILQTNGLIASPAPMTPAAAWVFQSFYLLLGFGLMLILGRGIRESLDIVRDSEQDLKENLSDLRQAQTQLEMSQENLRRREAILETLRIAAEKLFRGHSLNDPIWEVLRDLGQATGVDRVYIFENHIGQSGETLASQRYEWVADGITAQLHNQALQSFSFARTGFTRWAELLSHNEIIKGHVKDFPESERRLLAELGMVSVLVVPIFVGDDWWGFIGFDETQWERQWSPAEEDALRGAGGILGGAVERRRSEEALRRSEARYLGILQDQYDLISRYQPDGKIIFVNNAYARYFGFDPKKITDMTVWTQVPPGDVEKLKMKIRSLTQAQPAAVSQQVNRRADGQQRWVEWTDRGIFDEQGRLVEIQAVGRDINEETRLRKQLEDNLIQMENQAMSDPLTGLLNRRAIMEHAEAEWQRGRRERRPLSLIVMDVDNLKEINDTFGHLVGDQALVKLAAVLHNGMRRYDWAGRWGGDEFLLVLPGTGLKAARDVAERLRLMFKKRKLTLRENHQVELRVSFGVASQTGADHGSDGLQNMLARADRALYKAKQSGRDQVEVSS